MAFQKRSKGRQGTIFDCLDVNPLDSSASKQQRQQRSDETDTTISTEALVLTVACTSVTGVLGGVPDNIAVSAELSVYYLIGCVIHFIIIIN